MSMRSNMKKEIDMLNGLLWRKIILFALPIVTTSIVQQLFNTADTAIIEKIRRKRLTCSCGYKRRDRCNACQFISRTVYRCKCADLTVYRCRKKENIHTAVTSSMMTALIFGNVLAVVGYFTVLPLLKLINTPQNII